MRAPARVRSARGSEVSLAIPKSTSLATTPPGPSTRNTFPGFTSL